MLLRFARGKGNHGAPHHDEIALLAHLIKVNKKSKSII